MSQQINQSVNTSSLSYPVAPPFVLSLDVIRQQQTDVFGFFFLFCLTKMFWWPPTCSDAVFWLLQVSLIGEDIFYMVLQDVEKAASCESLMLLIQYGGNVKVCLRYKSFWSVLVFQHGIGRRTRLQHLPDESQ